MFKQACYLLLIIIITNQVLFAAQNDQKEQKIHKEQVLGLETNNNNNSYSITIEPYTKTNHENVQEGPEADQENPSNCKKCCSILSPLAVGKALIYRVFAAGGSVLSAYIWTNDVQKAFSIGGTNAVVATVLYYTYDRFWSRYCEPKKKDPQNPKS